jgi:membrane-bound lytic murein transglycosylase B
MRYLSISIIFFSFFLLPSTSNAQIDQKLVDAFVIRYAKGDSTREASVRQILDKATFQPSIIEKLDKPAEAMPWYKYRKLFMTDQRIDAGVSFWKEHETALREVSFETGVPAEIILGIIGVETLYGQRKGNYLVLDALYTIAFGYPKRATYFTSELGKFLELAEKEKLDITEVKGSYAGAMGYCQFMPSSYLAYAKSYDQEGTRDLINSPEDAISSVANYLAVHRWENGKPVAIEANATSAAQAVSKQSVKPKYTLQHYKNLGYEPANTATSSDQVTLLQFERESDTEYWFGYNNFYVITRYNHSELYAMAVYQLAEAVNAKRKTPSAER